MMPWRSGGGIYTAQHLTEFIREQRKDGLQNAS